MILKWALYQPSLATERTEEQRGAETLLNPDTLASRSVFTPLGTIPLRDIRLIDTSLN